MFAIRPIVTKAMSVAPKNWPTKGGPAPVGFLRGGATVGWPRLFEAAHQIAPHPLDQRRLLIQKIIDRLQQRLKPRVPLSADHS